MLEWILELLTVFFLLFGLFFMAVGAIGLVRMPDLYHRMHAATKGITLGITGLLIASIFALANHPDTEPVNILTRALLVIVFQFVANPVGAHLLSKAAHLDDADKWEGTVGDELDVTPDRHVDGREGN
ncbi:MAG: monovalent cation/H(+) antiporter subunit G [Phycisphaeraceae bacterium]|nr:monovalent cation/H(+) antiporter subunit G [Phycisphaeraceae bacterium]